MEQIAPAGQVYQAGTLSGNPLATAAGLATLRAARRSRLPPPGRDSPRRWPSGLAAAAAAARACRSRWPTPPGLLTPFFSDAPVSDYAGAAACDLDAHAAFCRAMLDRGVYLPPSQFEAWFPSLAHGDGEVERTLAAAREAFAEVAAR